MKKVLFALLCLSVISTGIAFGGNEREEGLINSLDVKTNNTIHGDVVAEDSTVNVGVVEIGGASITGVLTVDVNNEVGAIDARDGSTVSVGGFSGRNMTADDVTLTAPKNLVTGTITAHDGSQVYVGSAQLDNMKFGTVDITTTNTVQGDITATKGGRVNIGSVTN